MALYKITLSKESCKFWSPSGPLTEKVSILLWRQALCPLCHNPHSLHALLLLYLHSFLCGRRSYFRMAIWGCDRHMETAWDDTSHSSFHLWMSPRIYFLLFRRQCHCPLEALATHLPLPGSLTGLLVFGFLPP